MKTNLLKFSALFFMVSVSFIGNNTTAYAQQKITQKIETKNFILENGDSIYIKLTTNTPSTMIPYSNKVHTISGNKELLYKNANGDLLWSFTLSAAFSYTGNSATCTSVDTSSSFVSSSWKFGDSSKSKSGNMASGTITAYQYALGIRVKTVTEALTLTCSKNGELS